MPYSFHGRVGREKNKKKIVVEKINLKIGNLLA